ncbi:MAG TPA: Na+/H+ antiporter NhaA [Micavibrio sp.]|nr:Na+/H+ antiporter NhaA [Micavibrio sp.]
MATGNLKSLFEQRIANLTSPLERFIRHQATAGILLITLSLASLLLANTPAHIFADTLSSSKLGVIYGGKQFALSINDWVSQGLMAFFFLLTGLEIKREILAGHLQNKKEVLLLCCAALGGILVPALFYYGLTHNGEGHHGWAIPTATDTAFAVCVLALLATRVSIGLTVFLTALAIFDDIGAIAIISVFYAHDLNLFALVIALLIFFLLLLGNRSGIRSGWYFGIMGALLWLFIFKGGIHPTFAGLMLATTIPARTVMSQAGFITSIHKLILSFEQKQDSNSSMLGSRGKHSIVTDIGQSVREASTPLQRWEASLLMPISILILPLFAFLNAGFSLSSENFVQGMHSPVTLGIILGLVIGKPVGITLFSFLAIKISMGKLPEGVTLKEIAGAGMLAGIGFTMSIFFTTLSFPDQPELVEQAKLGIFISSLVSAVAGCAWIYFLSLRRHNSDT